MNSDIEVLTRNVIPPEALHPPGGSAGGLERTDGRTSSSSSSHFVAYHRDFHKLFKTEPGLTVICHDKAGKARYHEAGVAFRSPSGETEVYITSNLFHADKTVLPGGEVQGIVEITRITLPANCVPGRSLVSEETLPPSAICPTANGACAFGQYLIICNQGYFSTQPSSLVALDPTKPSPPRTILNNFNGRRFNSLNDVIVLSSAFRTHQLPVSHPVLGQRGAGDPYETIWFTDPPYASDQGFANNPELPPQVYCFDPWTGSIRAVADGFVKPNGIAFDCEGRTCYVTDTGMVRGDGQINGTLPGSIYAFDVTYPPADIDSSVANPSLTNRRLFAFTDSGAPDGVKVDSRGNVFAGCFDGIHVWNRYGTLLGKIFFSPDGGQTQVGCANFCFIPGGQLLAMAEARLILIQGLASSDI